MLFYLAPSNSLSLAVGAQELFVQQSLSPHYDYMIEKALRVSQCDVDLLYHFFEGGTGALRKQKWICLMRH